MRWGYSKCRRPDRISSLPHQFRHASGMLRAGMGGEGALKKNRAPGTE
jgi:hypothetical protein